MILQHLYWPGIRKSVQKEVTECDVYQRTKRSTKKNGKLPAKLAEETPWNKLCVDIIVPYKIYRKGKDTLILKAVTMIDHVTGWFEVTQYSNKKATMTENLVENTWLIRYPWPVEIMYDRGGEFLGHDLKKSLYKMNMVLRLILITPGTHRRTKQYRDYIKY